MKFFNSIKKVFKRNGDVDNNALNNHEMNNLKNQNTKHQSRCSKFRLNKFWIIGIFLMVFALYGVYPAYAGWMSDAFASVIVFILSAPALVLNIFLATTLTIILWVTGFIISLGQHMTFIYVEPVNVGWVVVRDLANTFLIGVMIIIGFGTILSIPNYSYKQLLPKLVFAAILVNFSKMICGVFIDFAEIIMISFYRAVQEVFFGGLLKILGLDQIAKMAPKTTSFSGSGQTLLQKLVAAMQTVLMNYVLVIFLLVVNVIVFFYMIVFVLRMVMIWLLVVLSPLPYVLNIIPRAQQYAQQWWSQFINYVILGPLLVFFLWLSLVSLGSLQNQMTTLGKDQKGANSSGNVKMTIVQPIQFTSFIVGIGMLLGGLHISQSIAGVAGGVVGLAGKAAKGAVVAGAALSVGAVAGGAIGLKRAGSGLAQLATGAGEGGRRGGFKKMMGGLTGASVTRDAMRIGGSKAKSFVTSGLDRVKRAGWAGVGRTAFQMTGIPKKIENFEEKTGIALTETGAMKNWSKKVKGVGDEMTPTQLEAKAKSIQDRVEQEMAGGKSADQVQLSDRDAQIIQAFAQEGEDAGGDTMIAAYTAAKKSGGDIAKGFMKASRAGGGLQSSAALADYADSQKTGVGWDQVDVSKRDSQGYYLDSNKKRIAGEDGEALRSSFVSSLDAGKVDLSKVTTADLKDKQVMRNMVAAYGDKLPQALSRCVTTEGQANAAQETLSSIIDDGEHALVQDGNLTGVAKAYLDQGGKLSGLQKRGDAPEAMRAALEGMRPQEFKKAVQDAMSKGSEDMKRAIASSMDTRNAPKSEAEATAALEWVAQYQGGGAMAQFDDPKYKFRDIAAGVGGRIQGPDTRADAVAQDTQRKYDRIQGKTPNDQAQAVFSDDVLRKRIFTDALDEGARGDRARDVMEVVLGSDVAKSVTGEDRSEMTVTIENVSNASNELSRIIAANMGSTESAIQKMTNDIANLGNQLASLNPGSTTHVTINKRMNRTKERLARATAARDEISKNT